MDQNYGNITIYRPSKSENKIYEYEEEYEIKDKVTYTGSEFTNAKNLEIGNQAGILMLRFCNNDLGNCSLDGETISHDGTILKKADIKYEDITCTVSFDITIELTSGTTFTGSVSNFLPVGNITNTGTSNYERTDFKDVVFKRNSK